MPEDTMTKSIEDAITERLPEHISRMLRERLVKADAALKDNETLTVQLDEARRKLKTELALETLSASIDVRRAEAEVREKACAKAEFVQANTLLTTQLECEKRITTILSNTLANLVRNTNYRESAFGNVPIINNGYAQGSAQSNSTTDRTAD